MWVEIELLDDLVTNGEKMMQRIIINTNQNKNQEFTALLVNLKHKLKKDSVYVSLNHHPIK